MTLSTRGRTPTFEDIRPAYILLAASSAPVWVKRRAHFVCDGTADSEQLAQAIAIATTSGVRLIQFTEGDFYFTAGVTPITNLVFQGCGYATVLNLRGNVDMFKENAGTSGLTWRHMVLDGNKASQTSGRGIVGSAQTFLTLEDVEIRNFPQQGASLFRCQDIRLTRVYAHDNGLADEDGIFANQDIQRLYGTDCRFDDNAGSGIRVTNNGGAGHEWDNVHLTNIQAPNNGADGVYLSDNGPTRSGVFSLANVHGYANTNDGILLIRVQNGSVNGCHGYNAVTGDGLVIDSCKDITGTGGTFYNNAGRGVYVTDVTDATLGSLNITLGNPIAYNNDQVGGGHPGIEYNDTTDSACTGARCYDDQTPKTQDYGIRETGSSDRNVFIGNNVAGNLTAGIAKVGASTIVRGNPGHVTENSGTATIASGATSVVVSHGLSVTPALDDISVIFGEQGTNDYGRWWVSTITATQFTINISADPGASNLDLAWRAVVL